VISTSRLLVQLNRNQVSARRGVIISGASGTGKTTALTQLGRTHELHTRKRYPADRHRLPVFYVTVPPAAAARMLAAEFARFLGLEFAGRAVCATAGVEERLNLNLASRAGTVGHPSVERLNKSAKYSSPNSASPCSASSR
jgi:ABC-type ATPase with predicted acetyltransferase domain